MKMKPPAAVGVDDCLFAKLACHQSCPQFRSVLIAFWLNLPIVLRILCLLCPSVGQGCLRFVGLLLFFSLLLTVFVVLEPLPTHQRHHAYRHQSLNQIVAVVLFELLLLRSVLGPLLVAEEADHYPKTQTHRKMPFAAAVSLHASYVAHLHCRPHRLRAGEPVEEFESHGSHVFLAPVLFVVRCCLHLDCYRRQL